MDIKLGLGVGLWDCKSKSGKLMSLSPGSPGGAMRSPGGEVRGGLAGPRQIACEEEAEGRCAELSGVAVGLTAAWSSA